MATGAIIKASKVPWPVLKCARVVSRWVIVLAAMVSKVIKKTVTS